MQPDISEFSYGYALTEELIHGSRLPLRAALLFPFLIEEGRTGGGFDVHIPFIGFPLFLQFKLSHCMVRHTAAECKAGHLAAPFYRMHLRPTRHSRQHQLLLDLQAKGELVYYAAPEFHRPHELNDAYLSRRVADCSVFIKPSDIGPLSDDEDHHVAFRTGVGAFFCSEPRPIRGEEPFRKSFDHDLIAGLEHRRKFDGSRESVERLASDLLNCVKERIPAFELSSQQRENLRAREPRFQIAYLLRTFFGCEAILVGLDKRTNAG